MTNMENIFLRWLNSINYPSYIIFFVTAKCNANCKMCFYKDNMLQSNKINELTIDEYDKISKNIKLINILGISGGEPFLREDLSEIIKIIYKNCPPLVVDLPTNGFFIDNILKQTEDIVKYCKNTVVDLQLSIDGPENIHNQIRGLNDGFSRMRQTYKGLVALKKRYRNLKVKACIVYSYYNQDYIEELFGILDNDFQDLDRTVFSVVHGSVSNTEALDFDWNKYFSICERIRKKSSVKNIKDFHSIFTIALRIVKNYFLNEILKTKDMFKICGAGKNVIVINETGKVFPCEPLWYQVGDLRENGYNIEEILKSRKMRKFHEKMAIEKCTCHWGLPLSNKLLYKPKYYPKILIEIAGILLRSVFPLSGNQRKQVCL